VNDDAQEQVRRLLAAAGAPPPETPEDVASRLDEVLAGLVAERDGVAATASGVEPDTTESADPPDDVAVDEPATVVALETRRRRWPRVLVAAAAVSVVALGVGNLALDGELGGADQAATAEGGSAQDEAGTPLLSDGMGGAAADQDEVPRDAEESVEQAAPEALRSRKNEERVATDLSARPVRLRTDSLPRDVQLVEDLALAGPASGEAWRSACVRPAVDRGDEWVSARLDGAPAVLVLRAPAGGRRTGDVFACDDAGAPVASVTVRAR
jgi:hypothetical protein